MAFFVTKVLKANIVMITPEWRIWKHVKGGNRVQIIGCIVPKDHAGRRDTRMALMKYLLNRKIELKNITGISGAGNLIAEVWVRGANVAGKIESESLAPKKAAKEIEQKREENNPETAKATHE